MCLDVGAINRGTFRDHAGIHQRVEQREQEATAQPAVEPIVDRRGWPIIGRQRQSTLRTCTIPEIACWSSNPPGAGLAFRQMRLNYRLRFIRQREQRHASLLQTYAPVNQEIITP